MKQYDEAALINQLSSLNINTSYLEADKNYLYNLILKSLRIYHSSRTSKLQILELIEYTEILYAKGLNKQANKQLQKAKKVAYEFDVLSLVPEILRIERKINGQPIKLKEIESQYSEYQEALEKLVNFHEYDFLYRKSNWIRKNEGKVRNEKDLSKFDIVLEHPLLIDSNPLSFFSNVRYLQTMATFYYSKDDSNNEYLVNKTLLQIFDNHPKIKAEHFLEYVTIFSRILILTKKIKPEEYQKTLLEFKDLGGQSGSDQYSVKSMVSSIYYSTELVRLINQGDFLEAESNVDKAKKILNTYSNLISDAFKINFYYKFAYIKIGLGKYSEALDYVNTILNDFDEKSRPDIFGYAKILATIIHFELGNVSILPYVSQSAYNHLRNRNKLYHSESILLNFIKKFNKTASVKKWNNSLRELRTKLLNAFEQPNERKILQYFDFISWLDSKIENMTFADAKKKNLSNTILNP